MVLLKILACCDHCSAGNTYCATVAAVAAADPRAFPVGNRRDEPATDIDRSSAAVLAAADPCTMQADCDNMTTSHCDVAATSIFSAADARAEVSLCIHGAAIDLNITALRHL